MSVCDPANRWMAPGSRGSYTWLKSVTPLFRSAAREASKAPSVFATKLSGAARPANCTCRFVTCGADLKTLVRQASGATRNWAKVCEPGHSSSRTSTSPVTSREGLKRPRCKLISCSTEACGCEVFKSMASTVTLTSTPRPKAGRSGVPQLTLKRRSLGPTASTGVKADMPSAPSMVACFRKAETFSSRPASGCLMMLLATGVTGPGTATDLASFHAQRKAWLSFRGPSTSSNNQDIQLTEAS
mmetsp:Transcript_6378/g.14706  ORF Transcript_6378/g.14706 Transcript_6378/m.14706 type:complete len:243 (-) Transcript_6378:876-1604(-)